MSSDSGYEVLLVCSQLHFAGLGSYGLCLVWGRGHSKSPYILVLENSRTSIDYLTKYSTPEAPCLPLRLLNNRRSDYRRIP